MNQNWVPSTRALLLGELIISTSHNFLLKIPLSISLSDHASPPTSRQIEKFQMKAQHDLQDYVVSTYPAQADRLGKLLLRLPALRLLPPAVMEELFFAGLIGNVQIDSIIPYILRMETAEYNSQMMSSGDGSTPPSPRSTPTSSPATPASMSLHEQQQQQHNSQPVFSTPVITMATDHSNRPPEGAMNSSHIMHQVDENENAESIGMIAASNWMSPVHYDYWCFSCICVYITFIHC